MWFRRISIWVKLDTHLLMEKRAGVSMSGFEIGDQI